MSLTLKLKFKFLILLFTFFLAADSVQAAPPLGFQSTEVVSIGLDQPTGLDIAPDGRIFILEKGGKVKIFKNGSLNTESFYQFPVNSTQDRGLLGIAFDPDFLVNKYVYFYYCGRDLANYVVRLEATGDVFNGTPVILYSTPPPSTVNHAGGTIRFGSDGKLYLSLGENGFAPNAQEFTTPYGKIIRLNKDGSVPSDNPFVGQQDKLPEIWAYGLRNPFRFQFDSQNGQLFAGDVGQDAWEEVDKIVKGGNYGWPMSEGACTGCTTINPIYQYGYGRAIVGGPIYRSVMFPEEYGGSYFFGDYVGGFIKRLTFKPDGSVDQVYDFETSAGGVVELLVAPDGSLYYINIFPGKLVKITYSSANQFPYAVARADVTSGTNPLTVNFNGSESTDPEGSTLSYSWDFGDGTNSNEQNPTKIYSNKGIYNVILRVSDGVNTANSQSIKIVVGTPPTLDILSPLPDTKYKAGDRITYQAEGKDSDGVNLASENFTTNVLLHHSTHVHFYLTDLIGNSGNFDIPSTGEGSADTWYEINMTVKDSSGLITTKTLNIHPIKTTFTLKTIPAGLSINIDGIPTNTPSTIEGVVGFKRELDAPVQEQGGIYYEFNNWSGGANNKHFVTLSESPTEYIAEFREMSPFKGEYFNNQTLQGTPALIRDDKVIDFDWQSGSPDPTVQVNNYSVRWTKTSYFSKGRYRFITRTDDGLRLYVDGVPVIDKWINQGPTIYTATVDLSSGDHLIVMEYFENSGDASAKLSWDLSPKQPEEITTLPEESFSALYFANNNLDGSPVLSRQEVSINNDWQNGSPGSEVPSDKFSARWMRNINFEEGYYKFIVTADDGVRLYVDNQLIIDKWLDQSQKTYEYFEHMNAGIHSVKLEYYENWGDAVAKFSYSKSTDLNPLYKMEIFGNKELSGNPLVTKNVNALNFNWGETSPDPLVQSNNFSVRFLKSEYFTDGLYEFNVTADDGVKIYLDDVAILDKWVDQSARNYKVHALVKNGIHTIKIEYYEHEGDASIDFSKTKISGFEGKYSSGQTNFTRFDDRIDFAWGGGPPAETISVDNFSATWTRDLRLDTGTYQFDFVSDDGIRFYINGNLVLDRWNDHSKTFDSYRTDLEAGTYNFKLEYYERWGDAIIGFDFFKL